MKKNQVKKISNELGAACLEYALCLALMAAGALPVLNSVGNNISNKLISVSYEMEGGGSRTTLDGLDSNGNDSSPF